MICNEFCPEIGDDVGVFLEDFLETLSIEAKTWRKDIYDLLIKFNPLLANGNSC